MKRDKLIDALGKIDDRLVLEVIPGTPVQKKKHWPTVLAAAAVLVLCAVSLYKLHLPSMISNPEEIPAEIQQDPIPEWSPTEMSQDEIVSHLQGILKEYDSDTTAEHHLQLQELFARYYMNRQKELQYLPVFSEEQEPDWEELTRFISLYGQYDWPMEETLFEAMIQMTLPGAYDDTSEINHRSSSWLAYENQCYSVIPMGLGDSTVYYQLSSIRYLEEETYQATLAGYAFWYDDFMANPVEHSENWNVLQGLMEDSVLTPENLEQAFLPYLFQSDPSLYGFVPSERTTVTFSLRNGATPFVYWSCERVDLNPEEQKEKMDRDFLRDFHDVFLRNNYFPGVEQVGVEARNAMMAYFEEDPSRIERYIGGSWEWNKQRVLGMDQAVLTCEAPVLKEVGNAQCFIYNDLTGTVSYGPSGSHYSDIDVKDIPQMIRSDLRNWEHSNNIHYLRDAIARYYFENPEELASLTKKDLSEILSGDGDSDVYYRLQNVNQLDDDLFEIYLEGMSIPHDDSGNPVKSANRSTVDWNYPWKHYSDCEREAIVRAMSSDKPYFEQGLELCSQLSVTVRLCDGTKPFEYLRYHLEYLDDSTLPLQVKRCHETMTHHYHYSDGESEQQTSVLFLTTEPLYDVSFVEMDYGEYGYEVGTELYHLQTLTSDTSLVIDMVFSGGAIEHRGISYTDNAGQQHLFVLFLSGKDGRIQLREIS